MLPPRSTSLRRRSPSSRRTGKILRPIVHRRQQKSHIRVASDQAALIASADDQAGTGASIAKTTNDISAFAFPSRGSDAGASAQPELNVPNTLRQRQAKHSTSRSLPLATLAASSASSPMPTPPSTASETHPLPRLQLPRSAARVDWAEVSATERAARALDDRIHVRQRCSRSPLLLFSAAPAVGPPPLRKNLRLQPRIIRASLHYDLLKMGRSATEHNMPRPRRPRSRAGSAPTKSPPALPPKPGVEDERAWMRRFAQRLPRCPSR